MVEMLSLQYSWVKESREILLQYCGTLSEEDFVKDNSVFGRGSIRNLSVHIANTYQFWIGRHALNETIDFTDYAAVKNVQQTAELFIEIDKLMYRFIDTFEAYPLTEISLKLDGQEKKASALQLFTHVITHEYHHKGQILSLSRQLGYVPTDTDIMR